ncbi:MAG: hypothetical protein LBJ72_14485, partial [Dysgonamonadaceae bacterium]|nr:hypothetical protein [Dysgonamonadaceae bacterium]
MSLTNTAQRERTWRRHLQLLGLSLLLFLFGLLPDIQGQVLTWEDGNTVGAPVSIGSSKSAPLEFYFYSDVAMTGAKVIILLPASDFYDNLKSPQQVSGSVTLPAPTVSGDKRTVTFSNVTIPAGQVVNYRIWHTATDGVPMMTTTGTATITIDKAVTNRTKNIVYNYNRASLLITPPDTPPTDQTGLNLDFGNNNGSHNSASYSEKIYNFQLECSGGSVDSIKITFSLLSGAADFSDWTFNGNTPSEVNFISSVQTTVIPLQMTYTLRLSKADFPGGDGFDDGEKVVIGVKAKKHNCGTTNIGLKSFWGRTVTAPYFTTTETNGALVANPSGGGGPWIVFVSVGYNDLTPTGGLVRMDGSPNIGTTVLRNDGTGAATGLVFNLDTRGYQEAPGFFDLSKIRYKIGSSGGWNPPKEMQIMQKYYNTSPYIANYADEARQLNVIIPDKLPAGEEIYIEWGLCYPNDPYSFPAGVMAGANTGMLFYYHGWSYFDECQSQSFIQSSKGESTLRAGSGQAVVKDLESSLVIKSGESKKYAVLTQTNGIQYTASRGTNAKYGMRIALPNGLYLNTANPDSIVYYYRDDEAKKWPMQSFSKTERADSTIYTCEFLYSERPFNSQDYKLEVDFKNNCLSGEDKILKADITMSYYPTGQVTAGSPIDVVFERTFQVCPEIMLICDLKGITYDFSVKRVTIGLRDADNNGIPDANGTEIAREEEINHNLWLYGDTAALCYKGTLLGTGYEKLYLILYSDYNHSNFPILENGIPKIEIDGIEDASVSVILKNSLSGGIPVATDRGSGFTSKRYVYVWELSKAGGFADNSTIDVSVLLSSLYTADFLANNFSSQFYASTSEVIEPLDPGISGAGKEEYAIRITGVNPRIYGSLATLTYNFSGQQILYLNDISVAYTPYLSEFQYQTNLVNEYRHLGTLDTLVLEVPVGYELPETASFRIRSHYVGQYKIDKTVTLTSLPGSTPNRRMYKFGTEVFDVTPDRSETGKVPLPADACTILLSNFPIKSTYSAPAGISYLKVYVSIDNETYFTRGISIPNMNRKTNMELDNYNNRFMLVYSDPGSLMLGLSDAAVKDALSSRLSWDLNVTNTKSDSPAYDVWLYVQGPVENASITISETEYSGEGEGNRWIRIPQSVAASSYIQGTLNVTYVGTDCSNQAVSVYSLFDRDNITQGTWSPYLTRNDASFNTADDFVYPPVKLTIQNVPSRISGSLTGLSNTPAAPSTPLGGTYNKETVKVEESFPVEIVFSTEGALGPVVNTTAEVTFPKGLAYVGGSVYLEIDGSNTQVSGEAIETVLSQLSGLATPLSLNLSLLDCGILNGEIKGNTTAKLRFLLEPTCDINMSAERIALKVTGNRPCGPDATN